MSDMFKKNTLIVDQKQSQYYIIIERVRALLFIFQQFNEWKSIEASMFTGALVPCTALQQLQ